MTLTTIAVLFALSQKAQPKPQHYEFTPQEIAGDREAPSIGDIYVRKPTKFKRLIKVRDNFSDKIVKSVDEM